VILKAVAMVFLSYMVWLLVGRYMSSVEAI
jgi:hypothetical protein